MLVEWIDVIFSLLALIVACASFVIVSILAVRVSELEQRGAEDAE